MQTLASFRALFKESKEDRDLPNSASGGIRFCRQGTEQSEERLARVKMERLVIAILLEKSV